MESESVHDVAIECGASDGRNKLEELVSAKQEHVDYSIKRNESMQARYIYGLLFFKTNLFALLIRDYGHKMLTMFHCEYSLVITYVNYIMNPEFPQSVK